MLRWGYDETKGTIIGGYYSTGQLYYDGRSQGGLFHAPTSTKLMEKAQSKIMEYKKEFCGHPCYLYADDTKWQLKEK